MNSTTFFENLENISTDLWILIDLYPFYSITKKYAESMFNTSSLIKHYLFYLENVIRRLKTLFFNLVTTSQALFQYDSNFNVRTYFKKASINHYKYKISELNRNNSNYQRFDSSSFPFIKNVLELFERWKSIPNYSSWILSAKFLYKKYGRNRVKWAFSNKKSVLGLAVPRKVMVRSQSL